VKAASGIVLLAVHQAVKCLPTAFDWLWNRRLKCIQASVLDLLLSVMTSKILFGDYRAFVTQLVNNYGIREQGAEEDIWA
jgi:hypothetical protein